MNRRKTDRSRWHSLIRENAYRDVWLLIITGVVAAALWSMASEGRDRRDQTCKLFEQAQTDARDRLVRTYDYLGGLSPRELRQSLNAAVIAQLPQLEQIARTSGAPAYCNEPGVGLPEPRVPVPMPQRPANLP